MERDDKSWLLRFARVWYDMQRLKRRRAKEHWSDRTYYRMVFAESPGDGVAHGDGFATTRAKITNGIDKDRRRARLLDLGTGLGFQARSLWDAGYRNVVACDMVPDRIALARRLHAGTGIRFLIGDMRSLSFAPRSLDAITISVALHDVSALGVQAVLAECDRALKAGGRFVLMEPRYEHDLGNPLHRWAYRVCGRLLDESVHVDEFLSLDVTEQLGSLGFRLVRRDVVWHAVLCLYVFEKPA